MGLTTNREDECLKLIRENGQQECYLVLPQEEIAKGFVRPVRLGYIHLRCGTATYMARAIAETYARKPRFYGGTYCASCGTHFDLRSLKFEEPGARVVMLDGKPVLAWHFAWLGVDGRQDGSYVGE